jgi:hypothetical protein
LPFNPVQGEIYELTATVNVTNTGFIGLGFADNVAFTGNTGGQNDNNAFRSAAPEKLIPATSPEDVSTQRKTRW